MALLKRIALSGTVAAVLLMIVSCRKAAETNEPGVQRDGAAAPVGTPEPAPTVSQPDSTATGNGAGGSTAKKPSAPSTAPEYVFKQTGTIDSTKFTKYPRIPTLSPDMKLAAFVAVDRRLFVTTYPELKVLREIPECGARCVFSYDGKHLYFERYWEQQLGQHLQILDLKTGNISMIKRPLDREHGEIRPQALTRDNRYLFATTKKNYIEKWDMQTKKQVWRKHIHKPRGFWLYLTQDEKHIIISDHSNSKESGAATLALDTDSGKIVASTSKGGGSSRGRVGSSFVVPDQRHSHLIRLSVPDLEVIQRGPKADLLQKREWHTLARAYPIRSLGLYLVGNFREYGIVCDRDLKPVVKITPTPEQVKFRDISVFPDGKTIALEAEKTVIIGEVVTK